MSTPIPDRERSLPRAPSCATLLQFSSTHAPTPSDHGVMNSSNMSNSNGTTSSPPSQYHSPFQAQEPERDQEPERGRRKERGNRVCTAMSSSPSQDRDDSNEDAVQWMSSPLMPAALAVRCTAQQNSERGRDCDDGDGNEDEYEDEDGDGRDRVPPQTDDLFGMEERQRDESEELDMPPSPPPPSSPVSDAIRERTISKAKYQTGDLEIDAQIFTSSSSTPQAYLVIAPGRSPYLEYVEETTALFDMKTEACTENELMRIPVYYEGDGKYWKRRRSQGGELFDEVEEDGEVWDDEDGEDEDEEEDEYEGEKDDEDEEDENGDNEEDEYEEDEDVFFTEQPNARYALTDQLKNAVSSIHISYDNTKHDYTTPVEIWTFYCTFDDDEEGKTFHVPFSRLCFSVAGTDDEATAGHEGDGGAGCEKAKGKGYFLTTLAGSIDNAEDDEGGGGGRPLQHPPARAYVSSTETAKKSKSPSKRHRDASLPEEIAEVAREAGLLGGSPSSSSSSLLADTHGSYAFSSPVSHTGPRRRQGASQDVDGDEEDGVVDETSPAAVDDVDISSSSSSSSSSKSQPHDANSTLRTPNPEEEEEEEKEPSKPTSPSSTSDLLLFSPSPPHAPLRTATQPSSVKANSTRAKTSILQTLDGDEEYKSAVEIVQETLSTPPCTLSTATVATAAEQQPVPLTNILTLLPSTLALALAAPVARVAEEAYYRVVALFDGGEEEDR